MHRRGTEARLSIFQAPSHMKPAQVATTPISPRPPGFRRWAAESASQALDKLGLLNSAVRMRGGRYIMAYHRVLSPAEAREEWCHPAIWIRPETLADHLHFFARVGRIVPLTELLQAPDRGGPLFSITFDDAWLDNLHNAVPVLDAHGVSASFFVPTDAVTTGRLFWTEELAKKIGDALSGPYGADIAAALGWPAPPRGAMPADYLLMPLMQYIEQLKELDVATRNQSIDALYERFAITRAPIVGRVMDWNQIRQLADKGHAIGSHSKSHLILRDIDNATLDVELVESKRILEAELGFPIEYFCFPNARYDSASAARVLSAGYSHGFRIHNLMAKQSDHRALVPRFSASEVNSLPSMLKLRLLSAGLQ